MKNMLCSVAALLIVLALLLTVGGCGPKAEESASSSTSSFITVEESAANDSAVSSVYDAILDVETELTDRILVGLSSEQAVLYSGKSVLLGMNLEISRDLNRDGADEYFRTGLNTPGGLRVLGVAESKGTNLAANFALKAAFDENDDIRADYYVQLSFLDLDGDGDEDVLVTAGNLTDLSQTLFYRFSDGAFTFAGMVMSGAKLRYDGQRFITTDDLTYVFEETLKLEGESGAEEVPVEISDDALAAQLADQVRPLVITLPDSFSAPGQLDKDVLLMCALFGYIDNTNPETRQYSDTQVLIPAADAAAQIDLLFGSGVALEPGRYPKTEDAFVYYESEDDTYRMPLAGYYADLLRVDGLEQTESGYVLTASHIANQYGEAVEDLESAEAVRVVKYSFAKEGERFVVTGVENVQ